MRKLVLSFLCIRLLIAEEVLHEEKSLATKPDIAKISEAFGHLLGKNLESMGMQLDIAQVIKGLKEQTEGQNSPMTPEECIEAIAAVQETAFKETASTNLKTAETFLAANKQTDAIHILEEGKLQYKITQEGKGSVVEQNSTPLIRYTGKLLNGSVFGSSQEDEVVRLDETIPGFCKGLIGMKEGEKRILYIHPNLGYGTHGTLPPNSLLTFEVEIVQANAPHPEALDALSPTTPKSKGNPEVATPFEEPKILR